MGTLNKTTLVGIATLFVFMAFVAVSLAVADFGSHDIKVTDIVVTISGAVPPDTVVEVAGKVRLKPDDYDCLVAGWAADGCRFGTSRITVVVSQQCEGSGVFITRTAITSGVPANLQFDAIPWQSWINPAGKMVYYAGGFTASRTALNLPTCTITRPNLVGNPFVSQVNMVITFQDRDTGVTTEVTQAPIWP